MKPRKKNDILELLKFQILCQSGSEIYLIFKLRWIVIMVRILENRSMRSTINEVFLKVFITY